MRAIVIRLVVTSIVVALSVPTVAGTINLNEAYNGGNPFMSNNYMWLNVIETNGAPNDPAFNFYRDPTTVGDSFIVNPTNFRAEVFPGPGLVAVDSQLEMVIMASGNGTIPFILFSESGDYDVTANVAGTAVVRAEVDYFWQVLEGSSAGASGMGSVEFSDSAAPNDSGLWELAFTIDIPDGATKVRFEYDNRLTANADNSSSGAFIAKKLVQGITVTIPEPGSLMLVLLGTIMGLRIVRQR